MLRALIIGFLLAAPPLWAREVAVVPGQGALALAIAGADPGDVLILAPGTYGGAVD